MYSNNYFEFSNHRKISLIQHSSDLKKILADLNLENISNQVYFNKENTKVHLISIHAMMIKITPLKGLIGSKTTLPDYILNNQNIISLGNEEDNLCFWSCLALAEGCRRDRYKHKSIKLLNIFNGQIISVKEYPGFDLKDLDKYEDFNKKYAINIISFQENEEYELLKLSDLFNEEDRTKIYLNLFNNHFSYISDMKILVKNYNCPECGKLLVDKWSLNRHMLTECTIIKEVYPEIQDSLFTKDRNLIYELCEIYGVHEILGKERSEAPYQLAKELTEIKDQLYNYNYLVTYDFEAMFKVLSDIKTDDPSLTNQVYTMQHIPVCVSISSNIPGFENKWIFNENPNRLVEEMFDWFDIICNEAGRLMIIKLNPIFNTLIAVGIKDTSRI